MPGFRGPDQRRIAGQMADHHYAHMSTPVTWRQYVSATGGVAVAGIGATGYYREQTISALLRPLPVPGETQTPAGMIAAAQFQVTTREALGRRDELVWANTRYRVEGPAAGVTLTSGYANVIVRGEP